MKTDIILRKLYREKKEFVTSDAIREYARVMGLNYENAMRHFLSRGHLIRIFRGIFYVRSPEEVKLGRTKYDPLKLVAMGLKLRGIENWYFGLHTALRLNNMTHEYFRVHEVLNDIIPRSRPMEIAGEEFKFSKLKPSLFTFGVIKDNVRFSDPEKTILDFAYLWNYRGVPEERTAMEIAEWYPKLSKNKIEDYLTNYPTTVRKIIERVER